MIWAQLVTMDAKEALFKGKPPLEKKMTMTHFGVLFPIARYDSYFCAIAVREAYFAFCWGFCVEETGVWVRLLREGLAVLFGDGCVGHGCLYRMGWDDGWMDGRVVKRRWSE